MEELIIIGSGPAGFTAGIYAGRAQLSPLLITGSAPGGLMALTSEIENYPGFPQGLSGKELTQLMQQQTERFGTRVQMDEVTGVDLSTHPFKVTAHGDEYETKALVIATGTSPRKPSTSTSPRKISSPRHAPRPKSALGRMIIALRLVGWWLTNTRGR